MADKRSNQDPERPRRVFKPIRLGDLTREWLEAEKEQLKTPNDAKSLSKPKFQYGMGSKIRTSVDSSTTAKNKKTFQSSTKALTQNRNDKQTLKSSMRISVMHEKNNENKRVQFSLPPTELSNGIIKVKNVTYTILNELRKGGSSVVYHCCDPVTNIQWTIKKVNLENVSTAVNEVKLVERLQECDRVIKMFDYELIQSEKLLLVVLERGELDLSRILKDLSNTNKHLPVHTLFFYWMEMLHAVKQIHENGIIHSELKPANFVLQAGHVLKLIDFGVASCVQDDITPVLKNFQVESFNYISPEALINKPSQNCESPSFGKPKYKVSYRSDVWSLGCILYQLVYGKTPFQHMGQMWGILIAVVDPNHRIDYPEVNWVPSRIVNTIKKCLQYNMESRPSVDELIQEYENFI